MSFAQDVWAHDSDEESCRLGPLTPVDRDGASWFFPVWSETHQEMGAPGDRPSRRDVGGSLGVMSAHTPLQETHLSDDHELPYIQCNALQNFVNSSRMFDCGVLVACAGQDDPLHDEPSRPMYAE